MEHDTSQDVMLEIPPQVRKNIPHLVALNELKESESVLKEKEVRMYVLQCLDLLFKTNLIVKSELMCLILSAL